MNIDVDKELLNYMKDKFKELDKEMLSRMVQKYWEVIESKFRDHKKLERSFLFIGFRIKTVFIKQKSNLSPSFVNIINKR